MKRRITALVAALALFAMLIPLTTGVVFAWSPPSIAPVCSTDQAVHNWTVTLATESNYGIQWADNSSFTSPTTVTMHAGANALSTPASVTTLYVRWASDHTSKSHATWSGGLCSAPPTTSPTTPPTARPTTPPTTPPTARPTLAPTTQPTTPPTTPPTVAPTETPFQVLLGETATPTVDPTQTPFERLLGETATPAGTTTPPPTSTGPDGSNGNSTPLFALLISLVFGGLGLAAVQGQRRSIRR
jgi:hypothetical protein